MAYPVASGGAPVSGARRPAFVDGAGFRESRLIAGLDRRAAAQQLGVSVRTIRNWEARRVRVPYSAFKLMRILSGYALPGAAWAGFSVRGDTLWSPEGKGFSAHDLGWWGLTCAMARQFRVLQASRQASRSGSPATSAALPPSLPASQARSASLVEVEQPSMPSGASDAVLCGVATAPVGYTAVPARRFVASGPAVVGVGDGMGAQSAPRPHLRLLVLKERAI